MRGEIDSRVYAVRRERNFIKGTLLASEQWMVIDAFPLVLREREVHRMQKHVLQPFQLHLTASFSLLSKKVLLQHNTVLYF